LNYTKATTTFFKHKSEQTYDNLGYWKIWQRVTEYEVLVMWPMLALNLHQ